MLLIGIALCLIALALWAGILLQLRDGATFASAMTSLTESGAAEKPRAAEERPEREPFEEGFANIMQFSVNGKTGFESYDTEDE